MPAKDKAQQYAVQAAHRARNRLKLAEYLTTHACVDCGEDDPIVLEFDHVRGVKKFEISRAVNGSTRSWKSISAEIDKCEVRCANCHRRATRRRFLEDFNGYAHLLPTLP